MAMQPSAFNWYDYETTGLSPHHDQIIQVSSIRTDADLNYIKGAELNLLVKLRPDVVPGPKAFAVHGISIDDLNKNGVTEFEAASHMKNWFLDKRNSMMGGYNTIPFDDEFTRNLMYRGLQDPYEHEWKNQNSRTDIMRLVMMVFALRPKLMNFHVTDEGKYSLKLGDVCSANGIVLDNAHDARSDVVATIEVARMIKSASPQLWQYFLDLSDKKFTKPMVDKMEPLVLVDRYLSRDKGMLTMALPIIYDAKVGTKMLSVDLRDDPTELLSLSVEELKRRIFTPSGELNENEPIKSIRDITLNKLPLITGPSIFKGHDDVVDRAGLDIDACMRHAEMIKSDKGFRERLQATYLVEHEPCDDVYKGIYALGFISDDEAKLRVKARALEAKVEGQQHFPALVNLDVDEFAKKLPREPLRMHELSLRAKWGNFGEEVLNRDAFSSAELSKWVDHLKRVWHEPATGKMQINLEDYKASLADVRASTALTERQEKALLELEAHVGGTLSMIDELAVIAEMKRVSEVEANKPSTPEEPSAEDRLVAQAGDTIEASEVSIESQEVDQLKTQRGAELESGPSL